MSNQLKHHKPFDGWSLDDRDPKFLEAMMPIWEWFYRYYFQVRTDGWEHIPSSGKFLAVGEHNGGLSAPDMYMFMYDWCRLFGTARPLYGLTHPNIWKLPNIVWENAAKCGSVVAHPQMAMSAFQRNAAVSVYPGGAADVFRPHSMKDQIYFAERRGFIKLALREEVPIIPMISTGTHDTLIVLTDIYPLMRQLNEWGLPWAFDVDPEVFPIYLGLPWLIGVGPLPNFPLPVRMRTRVGRPIEFKRYGRKAAKDRDYVDECYELVRKEMQADLDDLIRIT